MNEKLVEAFSQEVVVGDNIRIEKKIYTVGTTEQKRKESIILFHKPLWYVVSRSDPHNPTIFELLPAWRNQHYYPVGRLDKDSSGLLILTNTPEQVHELLHPSKKLEKVYEVIIKQPRDKHLLAVVKQWIQVDEHGDLVSSNEGELLKVIRLDAQRLDTWPTLLTITLHEWKKRHIRRLLRALGYSILSLKRISFWSRNLDDITEGKWVEYN